MRIVTLLVRHGASKFPNAISEVAALFACQLPDVEWDLVVIDNQLPPGYEVKLPGNGVLIGGSNMHREFSAWQDGLNYLGEICHRYDFVNLATEAFRTLYVSYLGRFTEPMLSSISGRAAALGHIDYYNAPVVLFGRQSQAWLRTCFVFVPPTELRLLGPIVSLPTADGIFSDDSQDPFQQAASLSTNYKDYLIGWLAGDGTGQGVQWHSRFSLSPDTLPFFKRKVMAILNEHLFSVRLRSQGCALADATWLASKIAAAGAGKVALEAIPPWFDQLAQRDVDAVPKRILLQE